VLTGFSRARISEGVSDPLTATVLAIESVRAEAPDGMAIMVCCELVEQTLELIDSLWVEK
jgi:hypothetical protein